MTDYLLRCSSAPHLFKRLSDVEEVHQNDIVFYNSSVFNRGESNNSSVLETIINNKLKLKYDYKNKKQGLS